MLINEKVRQAAELVREMGLDCWLTFTRESAINGDPTLVYLAPGPVTWHSAFLIGADGRARAVVGLYDKRGVEETGAYETVEGYVTSIRETLQAWLKEMAPRTIGVNFSKGSEICDGLTHGMFLTLQDILGKIGMADRMVSAEKLVSALRERKSAAEIGYIRGAIAATEGIFDRVAGFIKPGRTEKEIADFMLDIMRAEGLETGWDEATCPAVFTGPDTAQAHYSPTERPIERGHVLNMDFGVKVEKYCSDLQRTFYILRDGEKEAPADVRRGFETIRRAIDEARAAMKPGVQGIEVDAIARRIITEAGYDEFPHALGHQVGRFAHDGTALLGPKWEKYARKPFQKLEEGMVFTIEPRLTVPGKGVVTVEDMVVVTRDGADWLSTPQTELRLVE